MRPRRPIVLRSPGEKVAARILPVRPVGIDHGPFVGYMRGTFGAIDVVVPVRAGDSPDDIMRSLTAAVRARGRGEPTVGRDDAEKLVAALQCNGKTPGDPR